MKHLSKAAQYTLQFINQTNKSVFLTGKAGTGKTTFLRELAQQTHKRFVIVAPTGIAALNAKGVTVHSQFLFPFGSFLPTREPEGNFTDRQGFFTQQFDVFFGNAFGTTTSRY